MRKEITKPILDMSDWGIPEKQSHEWVGVLMISIVLVALVVYVGMNDHVVTVVLSK